MGHPSGIRSPSRMRSRRGYLLRASERGGALDLGLEWGVFGGAGEGLHLRSILGRIIIVFRLALSLTIMKPPADILCICMCVIPRETVADVWSWHQTRTRTLYKRALTVSPTTHTDTLSSLQALFGKPTHGIVCGAALPSRLCVGGTEPQALSVSIANVKSHVGCDEPPTIPGTITWRNRRRGGFRRPPRIAGMAQDAWAVFVLRPFSSPFPKYSPLKTD